MTKLIKFHINISLLVTSSSYLVHCIQKLCLILSASLAYYDSDSNGNSSYYIKSAWISRKQIDKTPVQ